MSETTPTERELVERLAQALWQQVVHYPGIWEETSEAEREMWRQDVAALLPEVRKAQAEALREAGVWLAGQRNGATGRRLTNAEMFGEMIYHRGCEIEYQAERRNRAEA